jgi:Zn-dependent peptidase ImmA (M78 family)
MPESAVRRFAERGLTELQMALRFDVSREAMHNRLTDLGLDLAVA